MWRKPRPTLVHHARQQSLRLATAIEGLARCLENPVRRLPEGPHNLHTLCASHQQKGSWQWIDSAQTRIHAASYHRFYLTDGLGKHLTPCANSATPVS